MDDEVLVPPEGERCNDGCDFRYVVREGGADQPIAGLQLVWGGPSGSSCAGAEAIVHCGSVCPDVNRDTGQWGTAPS
jgi:hypothetical protein